jgi:cleavage and polyadenylation specificity factor subunit 2
LFRWDFFVSKVEDYDVAYVSGVVQIDAESDLPVLERASFVNPNSSSSSSTQLALPSTAPPPAESSSSSSEQDALVSSLPPTTDEPPTSSDPSILPALKPSLFIGDLRLSLLKQRLSSLSIPSEFTGEGTLLCGPAPPESFNYDFASRAVERGLDPRRGTKYLRDELIEEAMSESGGKVRVRKAAKGRLVLDGGVGETYFVVRKVVYSLHAQAG